MSIPPELEAQILRYHHVEKWHINTIAQQLRVHHSTVARVLAQAGLPRAASQPQASAVDPFAPFITPTLEHPSIRIVHCLRCGDGNLLARLASRIVEG
jgi:hypothetical protein